MRMKFPYAFRTNRFAPLTALSLLMIGAAVSCTHPRVVDEDRLEWVNTRQSQSTNGWFWGLWREEFKLTKDPDPSRNEFPIYEGTLHHVSYRQSVLESLAAVVTLGIWMPGHVEWALSAPDARPAEAKRRQHTFEVVQEGRIEIRLSSQDVVSFEIQERGSASSLPESDEILLACRSLPQGVRNLADCQADLPPGSYFIYVEADRASAEYDLLIDQDGTRLLDLMNQEMDPLG